MKKKRKQFLNNYKAFKRRKQSTPRGALLWEIKCQMCKLIKVDISDISDKIWKVKFDQSRYQIRYGK